jgi:hypothetical protein
MWEPRSGGDSVNVELVAAVGASIGAGRNIATEGTGSAIGNLLGNGECAAGAGLGVHPPMGTRAANPGM